MEGNTATVLANGNISNIAEEDLQKGDILLLQAGDFVPADVKLVEARGLEVDEWELTGEIAPAVKRVNGEDVYLHRGSRVTRGDGKGVVVAVGEETEYEKILKQSWEQVGYRFPALVRWRYLILLAFLLPPFVVLLGQHNNSALIWPVALAMAVVVVLLQNNELFKYVLTISEAKKIRRRSILLHDVASLDVIGNLGIVCFDKTGVLTTRHIEVKRIYFADEIPDITSFSSDRAIVNLTRTACALCNDVFFLEKMNWANPIDEALISFALKNGTDIKDVALKYRRIFDKPFDSEDRYMASGFELGDEKLYFAKGDPEVVLKMCASYLTGSDAEKNVDYIFRQSIRRYMESIDQRGDIAIALAYQSGNLDTPPIHYTFLCLIQLENPLKPGVLNVVNQLRESGVRPVMLTGDRPETAIEVGRKAGIDSGSGYCLTGKHMARMGLLDVAWQSAYVSIFARVLPSQKAVLIRLFQQKDHLVAMVGDGANDTIALRAADVGISFVENSSPLARRVSKILINDLADLLTIIQSAKRIKWRVRFLLICRALILMSMLSGFYAWMLT